MNNTLLTYFWNFFVFYVHDVIKHQVHIGLSSVPYVTKKKYILIKLIY